jgi:Protein of unknown function (DUF1579)
MRAATIVTALAVTVGATGLALAQTPAAPAPGERKEPAAPGGKAPAGEVPKPALELAQLDWLKGTWRCDGTAPEGAAGPGSPAQKYKSTFKFGPALDGFWAQMSYEQKKSKTHPVAVKAQGMINWDASQRKFLAWGFDSMGGVSVVTAMVNDGGWSANGEQIMGGKRVPYRESITKKGDKEIVAKGEWKMGPEWSTLFEDTCKK